MGYISTEQVAEIRSELKRHFPNAKFSVKRHRYSTVCITILQSDMDFGVDYKSVNVHWIDDHYHGPAGDMLKAVAAIAQRGQKFYETGDYGTQPSHYVDIEIGASIHKPYVLKQAAPVKPKFEHRVRLFNEDYLITGVEINGKLYWTIKTPMGATFFKGKRSLRSAIGMGFGYQFIDTVHLAAFSSHPL